MQTSTHTRVSTDRPLPRPQSTLDGVHEAIGAGRLAAALEDLFDDLSLRREEEPETWPDFARSCLDHPLRHLLHQDPFTYRAFSKPRGYAGDAVMMDYIYGLGEASRAARGATPIGNAIFRHMATRPSARAVRYRRQLLATLIDRAASKGGSRVFALAAGHLREAEISQAVQGGRLNDFVAMDQDAASLAVIDHDYAALGVRAMNGSVRQILGGKVNLGQFDFVYAAGLFDYLTAPVAAALTGRLFEMTRPGGTMLIPNFTAGAPDSGYMEAFMDWHLIYRTHAEMQGLTAALSTPAIASVEIFDDEDATITFLVVHKN
jgi:extracellular factor (EF) 3-hydroxypalmitic acid methyl ester biosynthesis protein